MPSADSLPLGPLCCMTMALSWVGRRDGSEAGGRIQVGADQQITKKTICIADVKKPILLFLLPKE